MKLISFLAGLDQTNAQHGTTNDALLDAPKSRLSQILEALQHEDGYTMSEADQLYMTGWQHALMAIQGKVNFYIISNLLRDIKYAFQVVSRTLTSMVSLKSIYENNPAVPEIVSLNKFPYWLHQFL